MSKSNFRLDPGRLFSFCFRLFPIGLQIEVAVGLFPIHFKNFLLEIVHDDFDHFERDMSIAFQMGEIGVCN